MQAATINFVKHNAAQQQHQHYRIERQFSSQRQPKELVRDLMRAHSGE